jgi:hypothetical protein
MAVGWVTRFELQASPSFYTIFFLSLTALTGLQKFVYCPLFDVALALRQIKTRMTLNRVGSRSLLLQSNHESYDKAHGDGQHGRQAHEDDEGLNDGIHSRPLEAETC